MNKSNHMEIVAKSLGVDMEEVFRVTNDQGDLYSGLYFRITERGVEESYSGTKWRGGTNSFVLERLLIGTNTIVKLPWKPAKGEKYYIPYVSTLQERRYEEYHWAGDKTDEEYYKQGIIFRTKEEALSMTEKMLAFVREERNND